MNSAPGSNTETHRHAGDHLVEVHVRAVRPGDERAHALLSGRRRADCSEERPQRNLYLPDLAVGQVERADLAVLVEMPHEQPIRRGRGDHGGLYSVREPETWN